MASRSHQGVRALIYNSSECRKGLVEMKIRGSVKKLQKCVARTKVGGAWHEFPNGHWQFRTHDGAILNWWESSGTVNFQGKDRGRAFEKAFIAAAEAKQLITGEYDPGKNESIGKREVRRKIEAAKADIATLKWRLLRNVSPLRQEMIADGLVDVAKLIKAISR
jgi:hypothetical protein